MDWRSLLHNKWTWAAAGGAVLLGGITWYVRRKSGTTSTGTVAPTYPSSGLTADQIAGSLGSLPVDSSAPVTSANVVASTPPPATVPQPERVTVTAPANTNLYGWSQQIEKQYGLTTPVFSGLSGYVWAPGGTFPGYAAGSGNEPYYTQPTQVTVLVPQ